MNSDLSISNICSFVLFCDWPEILMLLPQPSELQASATMLSLDLSSYPEQIMVVVCTVLNILTNSLDCPCTLQKQ